MPDTNDRVDLARALQATRVRLDEANKRAADAEAKVVALRERTRSVLLRCSGPLQDAPDLVFALEAYIGPCPEKQHHRKARQERMTRTVVMLYDLIEDLFGEDAATVR